MVSAEKANSVHPLARWIAGLASPMSLRDQSASGKWMSRFMLSTVLIFTVYGYVMESVHAVFFAVAAAGGVSLLLWGPNWYQNEDPGQRWCDENEVKKYYDTLQKLREEAMAKITGEEEGKSAEAGRKRK